MDISVSEVKKENRRGFFAACDDKSTLIQAVDAVPGKTYHCPFCRCDMHLTHSKKGEAMFARIKDAQHVDPRCISIEKTGKIYSLSEDTPKSLCEMLCYTPKERAKREMSSREKGVTNDTQRNEPVTNDSDILVKEGFKSLKQIYDYGLDNFDENSKVGNGNYVASDYILYFRWADKFLGQNNELTEIDARIIEAQFINKRYFGISWKFYFRVFWKNPLKRGEYSSLRLIVDAASQSNNLLEKLCERYEDEITGKKKWRVRPDVKNVLIASDQWNLLTKTQCKQCYCKGDERYCDNCKGAYKTIYTNPKQIYLIPDNE